LGAELDARELLRKLARSPDLAPFRELVEPLAQHDRENASFLIRTLRAYFASGESTSEAAERLFLHRNSVPYRLDRISRLTGLDWRDPQARLALKLGLMAMDEERENRGEDKYAQ
jgi:DNA-binding PucR family transcriptional regulator